MGKLDTTAQNATTIVVDLATLDPGGAVVNGPEDLFDWDAIRWRPQEARVQRLRQRIFKATQAGDLKQVRNLQKGGLHLDTPGPDFPPQDLKYAKAVRVVPRPGWAVAAVLHVPVAAPVGSVRPCAATGR